MTTRTLHEIDIALCERARPEVDAMLSRVSQPEACQFCAAEDDPEGEPMFSRFEAIVIAVMFTAAVSILFAVWEGWLS